VSPWIAVQAEAVGHDRSTSKTISCALSTRLQDFFDLLSLRCPAFFDVTYYRPVLFSCMPRRDDDV
jgi:hypothetical protein